MGPTHARLSRAGEATPQGSANAAEVDQLRRELEAARNAQKADLDQDSLRLVNSLTEVRFPCSNLPGEGGEVGRGGQVAHPADWRVVCDQPH